MILAILLLGCRPADVVEEAVADAGPDLFVVLGEAAVLDGSGSRGAQLTWSTGDGTTADGAVLEHVYEAPGNYRAVLEATGTDGSRRTDAVRVAVHLPLAEVPPAHSSTIAVAGGQVWAVTPEAGSVAVIEADAGTVTEVPVCAGPRTVALDGTDAWIACEEDDRVVRLDADTLEVVEEHALPTGARPYGIVARDGAVFVSLQGTGQVLEPGGPTHALGPDPRGLALAPDGTLYASRFRSDDEQGLVYVLGGDVVPLALDERPDSDTTSRGVPNLLDGLLLPPDAATLFVPGLQANVLRGAHRDGQALTFQTTARAVLRAVDPSSGEEVASKLFDDQDRCVAAVASPHGDRLYVAHPGTRTLHLLDRWTLDLQGSILDAGQGITGLALDGEVLWVHAWLDRQVRAYDVSEPSQPVLLWTADTVTAEPLDPTVLAGKQVFHDSTDTRTAKDGYLACASCHPDGRDDGLVWDFTDRGEGLRNTISLEGRAGTAMGPLHWSANFDEVQDFENDMRHGFGGTGHLSDEDWEEAGETLGPAKAGRSETLDALAAYVSSLETTPASPHEGSAVGEASFTAHGCDDCHTPPLYTDSSLDTFVRHDVGTLGDASGGRLGGALDGLDTPTLLGAFATAPYLHDGSAPTVEEAIRAHDGTALSEEELEALASFVRSL